MREPRGRTLSDETRRNCLTKRNSRSLIPRSSPSLALRSFVSFHPFMFIPTFSLHHYRCSRTIPDFRFFFFQIISVFIRTFYLNYLCQLLSNRFNFRICWFIKLLFELLSRSLNRTLFIGISSLFVLFCFFFFFHQLLVIVLNDCMDYQQRKGNIDIKGMEKSCGMIGQYEFEVF